MRVIVNGEPREIDSRSVDTLLSELEYEGTHFSIAQNLSDALRRCRPRQNHPSSPGLTGRSSTPRRLGSTSGALEYWIPAFAGMTTGARGTAYGMGL